jgi:membrane protein implicated in regulation of membrane protease activity
MPQTIGRITGVVWIFVLGAIVLYGFFVALGAISPSDVTWLTVIVAVLAVVALIHFVRVRRALDDHRHNELARSVHAMRERRGF